MKTTGDTVDKQTLIQLAEEFGLPCIERETTLTIVGEQQLIIFNNIQGDNQCQLIEIY